MSGVSRLFVGFIVIFVVLYLLSGRGRVLLSGRSRVSTARRASRMTRSEALLVLGLNEGATEREITEAHRRLVAKVHPDVPGGSQYLASQLNQARDALLK